MKEPRRVSCSLAEQRDERPFAAEISILEIRYEEQLALTHKTIILDTLSYLKGIVKVNK